MAMSMPFTATAASKTRAARQRLDTWLAKASAASRVARARAGYAAGLVSTACGVGVQWGAGWALIIGGLACSWSFLHLYPVDES